MRVRFDRDVDGCEGANELGEEVAGVVEPEADDVAVDLLELGKSGGVIEESDDIGLEEVYAVEACVCY